MRDLESSDIFRTPCGTSPNNNITLEEYEYSGLPKVNLITFDGDQTKWKDFKDLFNILKFLYFYIFIYLYIYIF